MKFYINSYDCEYFYWIFQDKSSKTALCKGRASSLIECSYMLDYYKQHYGESCVITVKELGIDRWICTRANKI